MPNKSVSRREFLALAGAAGGAAVLAACQPTVVTQEVPVVETVIVKETVEGEQVEVTREVEVTSVPAVEGGPITISMWTHADTIIGTFQARAEEWKEKYPQYDFTFDFQQTPYDEVFTNMLTAISAGTGAPDMGAIEISSFWRFMRGGMTEAGLVPLEDFIGADKDKFARMDDYVDKGHIYCVEIALCPCAYYYQPALLEPAGIEMPIATWDDDFVTQSKLLKEQTGTCLGLVDDLGTGLYGLLLRQRGGDIFDAEGNVTIDAPEAVEVLQYLVDGANEGWLYKGGEAGWFGPATMEAFKSGKVVGVPQADWYMDYILAPQLADMSGQWRVAAMPVWKDGGHTTGTQGGTGQAIFKQSKNVPLVWDLLYYALMTKHGQIDKYLQYKFFPTMYEAMQDSALATPVDYVGGQAFGSVFAEVALDVPQQHQNAFYGDGEEQLADQLFRAFAGEVSPEEALTTAAENIRAIIAEGE